MIGKTWQPEVYSLPRCVLLNKILIDKKLEQCSEEECLHPCVKQGEGRHYQTEESAQ